MVFAIDPSQPFDYVLKCDRELPHEEQTVWELKPLDVREAAQIEDGAVLFNSDGQEAKVASGSTTIKILQLGLKGVRNFRNRDGSEVQFTTAKKGTVVSDTFLSRIGPEHRRELANAITEAAHLSEDERGK